VRFCIVNINTRFCLQYQVNVLVQYMTSVIPMILQ